MRRTSAGLQPAASVDAGSTPARCIEMSETTKQPDHIDLWGAWFRADPLRRAVLALAVRATPEQLRAMQEAVKEPRDAG